MLKWWRHCRGDKLRPVVYMNTGLWFPLSPTRSVLLRTRAANSSSSVHKLAKCCQKTGLTKLLKSSPYLTGSFFSNWSLARLFLLFYQCANLKWAELVLNGNVSMTSCNAVLPLICPVWRNARSHPTSEPGSSGTQLLLACSSLPSS